MNASTAAAIAALVVAVFAFLIAFAQALQQYAASGQLIRLCDSVVYGGKDGMPGQGRRVWSMKQFRFRILCVMPRLVIDPEFLESLLTKMGDTEGKIDSFPWSRMISTTTLGSRNVTSLPAVGPKARIGEATWVSLARRLRRARKAIIKIEMVEADADRCPADLPNIAMQISVREMAMMAVILGMESSDSSFAGRRLNMHGAAGSLSSTQHPVLGTLLRFEPFLIPQRPEQLPIESANSQKNRIYRACGFEIRKEYNYYPKQYWKSRFRTLEDEIVTQLEDVPWRTISMTDNHFSKCATPWKQSIDVWLCGNLVDAIEELLGEQQHPVRKYLGAYVQGKKVCETWVLARQEAVSVPSVDSSSSEADFMWQWFATYSKSNPTETLPAPSRRDVPVEDGVIEDDSLFEHILELDLWLIVCAEACRRRGNPINFDSDTLYRLLDIAIASGPCHNVRFDKRCIRDELPSSPYESRYLLVSLLRTAKMAMRFGLGTDTIQLQEILRKDLKAYLI